MPDSSICNIIFDLGGVILNIDYAKTTNAFIALGVENFEELYSQQHASSLFKQLECGKISTEEFMEEMKKYSPGNLTPERITEAWDAMLINFPPERIELLKSLKSRYRTFLLSNTNAIHLKKFGQMYKDTMGGGSLEDCFEKAYYSHLIGLRKPNKEAYEFVLNDQGLKPEETLFIDDTFPNIETAAALGIKTLYIKPPEKLEEHSILQHL
jgi:putative hydrolase of the HAD superfamily